MQARIGLSAKQPSTFSNSFVAWRRPNHCRMVNIKTGELMPFGSPKFVVMAIVLAVLAGQAAGQVLMTGSGPSQTVNIFNSDLAVLEAGEVRNDLPCTVTPQKPALGFDLRFHAGYEVAVPIREFAGSDNALTIVFRVTSGKEAGRPTYFSQHVRVPMIEDENIRGDATLQGAFDVGEGNYHVDWLMRDRSERVCSFYWDTEALLPSKDKQIELAIPPTVVQKAQFEQFNEEPPVQRAQTAPPINVKLLVNFAPQNFESATLRPLDTVALVSILRRISREPQFGKFSLAAFNIQDQLVLYRQQTPDRIGLA